MASYELQVIEENINQDTRECIERHKQTDFFTRTFRARKSWEPKCRAAAISKYQSEYDAARNELIDQEDRINQQFENELNEDSVQSVTKYVLLAVITGAIIVLIIKL